MPGGVSERARSFSGELLQPPLGPFLLAFGPEKWARLDGRETAPHAQVDTRGYWERAASGKGKLLGTRAAAPAGPLSEAPLAPRLPEAATNVQLRRRHLPAIGRLRGQERLDPLGRPPRSPQRPSRTEWGLRDPGDGARSTEPRSWGRGGAGGPELWEVPGPRLPGGFSTAHGHLRNAQRPGDPRSGLSGAARPHSGPLTTGHSGVDLGPCAPSPAPNAPGPRVFRAARRAEPNSVSRTRGGFPPAWSPVEGSGTPRRWSILESEPEPDLLPPELSEPSGQRRRPRRGRGRRGLRQCPEGRGDASGGSPGGALVRPPPRRGPGPQTIKAGFLPR